MEKATKMPKVIETTDGHHAVEIGDGVRLVWWNRGGKWSVRIESDGGINVLGVSRDDGKVAIH